MKKKPTKKPKRYRAETFNVPIHIEGLNAPRHIQEGDIVRINLIGSRTVFFGTIQLTD